MFKYPWKDVPGYEGKYQICIDSKECRCRCLDWHRSGTIKELSNNPSKTNGRIVWILSKDGVRTSKQAAWWVAITFPELVQNEYFEGAEIDHIDTDRLNNHPFNLRWVTQVDNLRNPNSVEHMAAPKPVAKYNSDGTIVAVYKSVHYAAKREGSTPDNIRKVCQGKVKTHKGFIYKYLY